MFSKHLENLDNLFRSLQQAKLQVKLSKCKFGRHKVIFLGHVVLNQGVLPNPTKTEAIVKMKPPVDIKGLQRFLGMTSYYWRFIQNYAMIAELLNQLLQKGSLFKWNEACQFSFNALKEKLVTGPCRSLNEFILQLKRSVS